LTFAWTTNILGDPSTEENRNPENDTTNKITKHNSRKEIKGTFKNNRKKKVKVLTP